MGHESTRALLVPFTQRLDQRKPHRIVGERADQPAMGEAAAVAMGMANAQRQNDRAIVGFRIKRLLRIGQRTGAKVTLVAFGHLFGAGHPLSSQPLHAAPNHKAAEDDERAADQHCHPENIAWDYMRAGIDDSFDDRKEREKAGAETRRDQNQKPDHQQSNRYGE
jgi:hypothetical protein